MFASTVKSEIQYMSDMDGSNKSLKIKWTLNSTDIFDAEDDNKNKSQCRWKRAELSTNIVSNFTDLQHNRTPTQCYVLIFSLKTIFKIPNISSSSSKFNALRYS